MFPIHPKTSFIFVAFVEDIMPLWVHYGILKIMYHILFKTEGSKPYYTQFQYEK